MSYALRISIAAMLIVVFLCSPGPTYAASITEVEYRGFAAYELTESGRSAIVVPALGSVLWFGFRGERNWLMNLSAKDLAADRKPSLGWRNWGGDKTWLGPQIQWPSIVGQVWPPDIAWADSNLPHKVGSIHDGVLTVVGPVSQTGFQITRAYSFETDGTFVVKQTVTKRTGSPTMVSIWSDNAVNRPDSVYFSVNSPSTYSVPFYRWICDDDAAPYRVRHPGGNVLGVALVNSFNSKMGTDSPQSMVAAVRNNELFVERAKKIAGDYADGPVGAGCNVEVYDSGPLPTPYAELEILSPLLLFSRGTSWSYTVQWSLVRLPKEAVGSIAATDQAVVPLITASK